MPTLQSIALLVFVTTVGLNVFGLGIDAALHEVQWRTISEFARKNQWLAAIIIAINGVGIIALAVHLSNLNGE